jgi:hypothetical protein
MNHLDWFYYKNQDSRARWYVRWAHQGGSFFYPAHSLKDLRSDRELERWRSIQMFARARRDYARRLHEARYPPKKAGSKDKVVNLNAVRFSRERRQTVSRVGMGTVR